RIDPTQLLLTFARAKHGADVEPDRWKAPLGECRVKTTADFFQRLSRGRGHVRDRQVEVLNPVEVVVLESHQGARLDQPIQILSRRRSLDAISPRRGQVIRVSYSTENLLLCRLEIIDPSETRAQGIDQVIVLAE